MIPWKKIRKVMPQSGNMIELQTFNFALQCLYITTVGSITELGYKLYLSLLAVTGKNSFINEPPRKTYIWFLSIDELKTLEFVIYNNVKHEYVLTERGINMLKLLAKGLTNQGVPKL